MVELSFGAALESLLDQYAESLPYVATIEKALADRGHKIVHNDHVAFRSFGRAGFGIDAFEKWALASGFEIGGDLTIDAKKLNARWYKPPSPTKPRVFFSELRVDELSNAAAKVIDRYLGGLPSPFGTSQVRPWLTPTASDIELLAKESEYASWTLAHGYRINHFTMSVHALSEPLNTLEGFNDFVRGLGVVLNDSGGEIKESPDGLLRQTSSIAPMGDVLVRNPDGMPSSFSIPTVYIEFAERLVLPEFRGLPEEQVTDRHRRDGFAANNANRIFESTFTEQSKRAAD